MRLTLTLPEIERGWAVITGKKDRQIDIARMAKAREPLACSPVRMHDSKIVAAIVPTGEVIDQIKGIEIKFRPAWCKTFLICAMRKDTITSLVCEFEFGKYWIDTAGVRKADLTLGGNGTNPETVQDSELVFGRMLAEQEQRHPIFEKMIEFTQRSF